MIYLDRFKSDENGTFGMLTNDSGNLCFTVELPWNDNHPQTSCIPKGIYTFNKYLSPKHGQVWICQDVPNRTNIEIHAANTIHDLLGCVGVGDKMGVINGFPAVLDSQSTLAMLRSELPDSFQLTVTGVNL